MLYKISKVFSDEALNEIQEDAHYSGEEAFEKAKLSGNANYDNVDVMFRSTKINTSIDPDLYPELKGVFTDVLSEFDPSVNANHYEVKEFNYLKYDKNDFFKKHIDYLPKDKETDIRKYSVSTLINSEDDFKGGALELWDENNNKYTVELKQGESVIFKSTTPHEALKIVEGTREVLVSWIYLKENTNE